MKIVFSICSNNFLAQAKTVLDSVTFQHPDYKTFIFLVDLKDPSIDYSFLSPAELVVVDEEIVPGLLDLAARYTIMELNSSVRPDIISYLQNRYPGNQRLYYIDPDMYVYGKLDILDEILNEDDIIVTPHFLSPLPMDGHWPFENLALNFGTYNLGFLAMNPSTSNFNKFLEWWKPRTRQYSQIDLAKGFFTDQIWFNLAPLFFKGIHSLLHPGFNMSAWNLHERKITAHHPNGEVEINGEHPLLIYHFSSWNYFKPEELSREYDRESFATRPDLVQLYHEYREKLEQNRMDFFSKIPCRLPYNKKEPKVSVVKKVLSPGVDLMKKIWNKV